MECLTWIERRHGDLLVQRAACDLPAGRASDCQTLPTAAHPTRPTFTHSYSSEWHWRQRRWRRLYVCTAGINRWRPLVAGCHAPLKTWLVAAYIFGFLAWIHVLTPVLSVAPRPCLGCTPCVGACLYCRTTAAVCLRGAHYATCSRPPDPDILHWWWWWFPMYHAGHAGQAESALVITIK